VSDVVTEVVGGTGGGISGNDSGPKNGCSGVVVLNHMGWSNVSLMLRTESKQCMKERTGHISMRNHVQWPVKTRRIAESERTEGCSHLIPVGNHDSRGETKREVGEEWLGVCQL